MSANEKPYRGDAGDLYLPPEEAQEARCRAHDLPCWVLSPRQHDDIELILNGAFSPLEGFMEEVDYRSVLESMRLAGGRLWPIPVVLDVTKNFADGLSAGSEIALVDFERVPIAILELSSIWTANRQEEAEKVYGTADPAHAGIDMLLNRTGAVYLGGRVRGISVPGHYGFKKLRLGPAQIRAKIAKMGWDRVIAFHTRSPMHYAQVEIARQAALKAEAGLLIHPTVGQSGPSDFDRFTRVRCYEHIIREFPVETAILGVLPLSARFAGPREALWHGIIEKNYGCTHLIVGPSRGGCVNQSGSAFYSPTEAQELFQKHQAEMGISMVPAPRMVYVESQARFLPEDSPDARDGAENISQRELKRRLQEDVPVPDWFSPARVVSELRQALPRRLDRGFAVFFTGLSGAGKSTIANALLIKLLELGGRRVTLLDGDIVRKNLSSELTFSKEHRDLNILRIGFVASEIAKHGGIAICAPIAPYTETRRKVRESVEATGGFLEVYVATTLETCESRDRKGLYAAARAGKIDNFTGINDPYEEPENPEVIVHTEELSPDQAADRIIGKLVEMGYLD